MYYMHICMVHGVKVNVLRAWYRYEHLLHNNVFLCDVRFAAFDSQYIV